MQSEPEWVRWIKDNNTQALKQADVYEIWVGVWLVGKIDNNTFLECKDLDVEGDDVTLFLESRDLMISFVITLNI